MREEIHDLASQPKVPNPNPNPNPSPNPSPNPNPNPSPSPNPNPNSNPNPHQVFQLSKCSACHTPLDLPSVHFLCMHSFHQG